jgi:hypothetical protein
LTGGGDGYLAALALCGRAKMSRLRCERVFDDSITDVFIALVRMLALRRWDPGVTAFGDLALPRPGCRYTRQTATALREGRVVEIIRPVSVTLVETLHDPPCRVMLRQRWRLHPVEAATLLTVELDYRLNQAATLRRLHWRRRLERHGRRMLDFVGLNLDWQHPAETADSTR